MVNDKGEEVGIIYGWYNTLTDMWYVGQTIHPKGRFNVHIRLSSSNDKSYFHKALRKYKLENWIYCVLEDNILRENLNMKEQEWIEYYDSFYCGYNETAGGGQTIFSEEVKQKMSNSRKGQLVGIRNGMYGKHHSKESREKMSEATKGINNPFYGKHRKESTKQKISISNKGKHSFNGMYGKHHKESTKQKMSISNKNKSKVNKYDLNGNFICFYNSITEAMKENPKAGHISDVCRGIRKQAAGFIWKYAS